MTRVIPGAAKDLFIAVRDLRALLPPVSAMGLLIRATFYKHSSFTPPSPLEKSVLLS